MNNESERIIKVIVYTLLLGLTVIGICFAFTCRAEDAANNVIVGFFGILATFVVIGNYSQVSHLIDENRREREETKKQVQKVEDKIEDLKKQIKNDDGSSRIDKLQEFVTSWNTGMSELRQNMLLDYQKELDRINHDEFTNIVDALLYLVHGSLRTLVSDIISNNRGKSYTVKLLGKSKTTKAKAIWKDNRLIFLNNEGQELSDIEKVSGKKYEAERINKLIRIFLEYSNIKTDENNDSQSIFDLIFKN